MNRPLDLATAHENQGTPAVELLFGYHLAAAIEAFCEMDEAPATRDRVLALFEREDDKKSVGAFYDALVAQFEAAK